MIRQSVILSLCLMFTATSAFALDCTVADPSGTPLNVRARPMGPILGALHNDTTVFLHDATTYRGQEWVRVTPDGQGRSGWVIRDYLQCD